MIDVEKLWKQTKELCQNEPNKELLIENYEKIKGIYKYSDGVIYLLVEDNLTKFRLEKFYLEVFNNILKNLTTEAVVYKIISEIDTNDENEAQNKPKFDNSFANSAIQHRMLRKEYTFDQFVVGDANKEAYTFATKITKAKAVTINPFYIFGDVGLGKTHLMNAIGHLILDKDFNKNVVYVTTQQFVEDFFKAKIRNQKDTALADSFDYFYRNADVLLVDDIQFLENKQTTQEEFFKIFEELISKEKQIIITSDRPANELNIMARLKSRFSWGIQTNLQKPNLELRKSIAKNKIAAFLSEAEEQIDVSDEVIDFVCENFDENVRELEGAIRRLVSYCVSFNIDFTLENTKMALSPILTGEKVKEQTKNTNKFEVIKDAVSRYFNINSKDLTSTSRKKSLVYARDLAIYIAKTKFDISFSQLGENLGHRDHATIMHSFEKTKKIINDDATTRNDVANIVKIIEKNH